MAVTFRVEQFEGPLDLLLQLVEQEKLDISGVSLASVADQFVRYVQERPRIPLEDVADFLVIAAKLVYLKSKLLLPSFSDQEMEEGPDLESQLRRYRAFVEASKEIDAMWKSGARSYVRPRRPLRRQDVGFRPPEGVTPAVLAELMQRAIRRLEPIQALPLASVERAINIQDKIRGLLQRIKEFATTSFSQFVGKKAGKPETVVSFLALLELVKQRFIRVTQNDLFNEIDIEAHPEAPVHDPLVESYI